MKMSILLIIFIQFGLFSQNKLLFYDIDDSGFPLMKAKFYVADSLGNRINDLDVNDINIYEDNISRQINRIYCPPDIEEPIPMSSVLIIDVSGSMEGENLTITKEVGKNWIDLMQSTNSECGITSFNSSTKYIIDLTKNYPLLHQKLDGLIADGGTDYDFALSLQYSGLEMVSGGQYIKNVVMITDGRDTLDEYEQVIDYAQQNSIIVNVIALKMSIPYELTELTKATGGLSIDNIHDYDSFLNSILEILNHIQSFEPCEIEWISDLKCNSRPTKIDFVFQEQDTVTEFHPTLSENIATAEINPKSISFIDKELNITHDTTFTITATKGDFAISEITSSHSFYNIIPQNIYIPEGETREFTLSYTPNDSIHSFNFIKVINNRCELNYFSAGGYKDKLPENESRLKLTHPNGGEIFKVGSDTIITWENVLPDDTVRLEYSYNNGKTWNLITNYASGLKYKWENIPYPTSDDCLVRVSQYEKEFEKINYDSVPYKIFEKNFGGSKIDILTTVKVLKDSTMILIGNTESDDFDISNNNGGKDIAVFKLNKKMNLEWSKNYGGLNHDYPVEIIEIDDGFLLFANSASVDGNFINNSGSSDVWILKINFLGELIWIKNLKGSGNDFVNDVIKVGNFYYLTGTSNSNNLDFEGKNKGESDIFVAKLDENCNIIWLNNYGGSKSESGKDIKIDVNNNIIIASESNSTDGDVYNNKGDKDVLILILDEGGNLKFSFNFGGSDEETVSEVIETLAGDYVFIGGTNSIDKDITRSFGNNDVWVVKFDILGNIIWDKPFGGGLYEYGICIQENEFGEYFFGALSNSSDGNVIKNIGSNDYWFVKIDNIGQIIWEKTFGGSMVDELIGFTKLYDGSYILGGSTRSEDYDISRNNGLYDFWIINVSPDPPTLQNDVSNNVFSIVSTQIDAMDIDMGEVVVGTSKDSLVIDFILNSGSYSSEIKEINFVNGDYDNFELVSNFTPFELYENSSKDIEFRFSPSSVGLKQSTIEVITQSDTLIYNITGIGVEAKLQIVSNNLDFGWVELGEEKTIENTVMIKNVSDEIIEIIDAKIEYPNQENFTIISGGGNFNLMPDEERQMTVSFSPTFQGGVSGNIMYYFDKTGSPAQSNLFGRGISGLIYPDIEDGYTNEIKDLKIKLDSIKIAGLESLATSYKIKLSYNGTMLAPIDNLIKKEFITSDRIMLELEGLLSEVNGDLITSIPMAIGLGNDTITDIRIEEVKLLDDTGEEFFYDLKTRIDEFHLLGYCEEGGVRLINPENELFLDLNPNPVENILNVNVNLIEKGFTKIDLYSSTGSLLETIFEKDVNELANQRLLFDMSKYNSGVYFVKFQSPTIILSEKVSLIK